MPEIVGHGPVGVALASAASARSLRVPQAAAESPVDGCGTRVRSMSKVQVKAPAKVKLTAVTWQKARSEG